LSSDTFFINFVQDASSSHPSINYRLLDWSAALDPITSPRLHALLQDEINAELILGADIVSFAHVLYTFDHLEQIRLDL
jgi:hypothetical protein